MDEPKITKLPDDWRLSEGAAKNRAFVDALSPADRKRFYESQKKKRYAKRKNAGPPPERLTRTKFPFTATINGREVTVDKDDKGEIMVHPHEGGDRLGR